MSLEPVAGENASERRRPDLPLVRIAGRVVDGQLMLLDAVKGELPKLIREGLNASQTLAALEHAFDATTPPGLASAVAFIFAALTEQATVRELGAPSFGRLVQDIWSPFATHQAMGGTLSERTDYASLILATQHLRAARRYVERTRESYARLLVTESDTRRRLAELGVDQLDNLMQAIALAQDARRHGPRQSQVFATALMNEAIARDVLANLGVDGKVNLLKARNLFLSARTLFSKGSDDYHRSELNEAACCVYLADHLVHPLSVLADAIELSTSAREHFSDGTPEHGLACLNEANARRGMAEWHESAVPNLKASCLLFAHAQTLFDRARFEWRIAVEGEVGARRELARLRHQPLENLALALDKLAVLRTSPATDVLLAEFDNLEAGVYADRALQGDRPVSDLKAALERLDRSRRRMDPTGRVQAAASSGAGNARLLLADLGEQPQVNRELALQLFDASAVPYTGGSPNWAVAQRNAARALAALDRFEEAVVRIDSGLEVLEKDRGGLGSERERIAFSQTVRGQFQDATAICLRGRTAAPDPLTRRNWELRAWHYMHRAKSRALIDVLARHGSASSVQRASAPLAASDVPPPHEILDDLSKVAAASGGDRSKTLLVELFPFDDGKVLVILAPLWVAGAHEFLVIPMEPGRLPSLARGVLDATRYRSKRSSGHPAAPVGDGLQSVLDAMRPLVDPWAERLEYWNPDVLVLSPHGWLNLIPVHATAIGGLPLIERHAIATLPTPAMAPWLLRSIGRTRTNRALVIGNPSGDLQGAEREAKRVSERLEQAGLGVTLLIGSDATSERVVAEMAGVDILHFAGHSALQHDEFLLSGLELNDRRLTIADVVATINLSAAELVYLSSCDSALASVRHTDELMALTRAFLHAGSPTVVASLWPLDDHAGEVFATRFYDAWKKPGEKCSKASAFRVATLGTRRELPTPELWVPFTLVGAW